MVGKVNLSGKLIDPISNPISEATIILKAIKSGDVLSGSVASFSTGEDGSYSVTVPAGSYQVFVLVSGSETQLPGVLNIFDYSGSGTLQEYLYSPCSEDDYPAFYLQMYMLKKQFDDEISNVIKGYYNSGGAIGFPTVEDMNSYSGATKNALAMVLSTGQYYYYDGTSWQQAGGSIVDTATKAAASSVTNKPMLLSGSDFSLDGYMYDSVSGGLIADSDCMKSKPISVKRGDCFVINNKVASNKYYETAVMLNSDGSYSGLLVANRLFSDPSLSYLDGSTENERLRGLMIAPSDGLVVFQYPKSDYVGTGKAFTVEKVSWDEFCDVWTYTKTSKKVLRSFFGSAFSPIFKKTKQSLSTAGNSAGQPMKTNGDTDTSVTDAIPVKKGQYVHFCASRYNTRASLFFSDKSDNFIYSTAGNADLISGNVAGGFNIAVGSFNIPVYSDGFVRLENCVTGGQFCFITVTEEEVRLTVDYLNDGTPLFPYIGKGYYTGTNNTDKVETHFHIQRKGNYAPSIYKNDENGRSSLNLINCTAKPVILKKGSILVYRGKFQTPLLGSAVSIGGDIFSPDASANVKTFQLVSPSVMTPDNYMAWAFGKYPDSFSGLTYEGEAHFYAEDSDYLIYLQGVVSELGAYNFGDVKVFNNRDEYRDYRDNDFLKRIRFGGGTSNNDSYNAQYNQSSFDYFIVFDDEIAQMPKVGTWWQNVLLSGDSTEKYQLFSAALNINSMFITYSSSPDDFKNPTEGTGFYYMAGIDESSCLAGASSILFNVSTDSNGNSVNTILDVQNLIDSFPVRVVKRGSIGVKNMGAKLPTYTSITINNPSGAAMAMIGTTDTNNLVVPVVKGCFYHCMGNVAWNGSGIPIFFSTEDGTAVEVTNGTNTGIPQSTAGTYYQSLEVYFKAPSNGYLIVPRVNILTGGIAADSFVNTRFNDSMELTSKTITEDEYNHNFTPISGKEFQIPYSTGMSINLIGFLPIDTTKEVKTNCVIQFLNNGVVQLVANAEVGISGNGTVSDPKKGYNIKLTDANGKKLKLKIGDMNSSNKWGLKAYYLEGTNTRDQGSNEVWRVIRRTRREFLGQDSALSAASTNQPYNFFNRPFSTEGEPVRLYVGGKFFGVYSIRTRAENPDYLLEDKNKKHVKISPDWGLHSAYASWGNFDFTYWDLITPEVKKYTEGDATVPDAEIQSYITRLSDFLKGVQSGSVQLDDNLFNSYFDRDSFVDYMVFSQITGNTDGLRNNVSVTTWDGNVWGLYPYDLDRTAGLDWGTSKTDPSRDVLNQDEGLNKLIAFVSSDITERYKKLRSSGVITADSLMMIYTSYSDKISEEIKAIDNSYWNVSGNDYQNMAFIYQWYVKRLSWMDSKYK